jgi:hypothetical protein
MAGFALTLKVMSDKSLYAVAFTVIWTEGAALDGQVVLLAGDEVTAKSQTQSWLSSARPWLAGRNPTSEVQRSDLGEPEELMMLYAYGIGTKPLFWEMRRAEKKELQSAGSKATHSSGFAEGGSNCFLPAVSSCNLSVWKLLVEIPKK